MKKRIWLTVYLTLLCIIILIFYLKIKPKEASDTYNSFFDNSKSSIVMDLNTGRVLYENNKDLRMLPASITKILTCIVAIEHYNLDKIIVVGKEILEVEGSSIYLKIGDVVTVKDLLYGLMLRSGNDAAIVLAKNYSGNTCDFIYLMNETCKKIGMKNSTFENSSGLDSKSKNYTTSSDMAKLVRYAMKNKIYRKIVSTKCYKFKSINDKTFVFENKHKLLFNDYDGFICSGGKTGYTINAKRTLVTTFKKDDFEIVVITLNCFDDWKVHTSLARYVFSKYKYAKVLSKSSILFNQKSNNHYYIDSTSLKVPHLEIEKLDYKIIETNKQMIIEYYVDGKKEFENTFFTL